MLSFLTFCNSLTLFYRQGFWIHAHPWECFVEHLVIFSKPWTTRELLLWSLFPLFPTFRPPPFQKASNRPQLNLLLLLTKLVTPTTNLLPAFHPNQWFAIMSLNTHNVCISHSLLPITVHLPPSSHFKNLSGVHLNFINCLISANSQSRHFEEVEFPCLFSAKSLKPHSAGFCDFCYWSLAHSLKRTTCSLESSHNFIWLFL